MAGAWHIAANGSDHSQYFSVQRIVTTIFAADELALSLWQRISDLLLLFGSFQLSSSGQLGDSLVLLPHSVDRISTHVVARRAMVAL